MRRLLICGASSGLGLAIAEGLPLAGDEVWLNSRNRPRCLERNDGVVRHWVPGDLSQPEALDALCARLRETPLDGLIFTTATWESDPDLTRISTSEIYKILSINAAAFVALSCRLRDSLAKSHNARAVAIGSLAGLENAGESRAVYSASKFALRGAVHGLREFFRRLPIGVTVISPGSLASDVDFDRGTQAALEFHEKRRIPSTDIISVIRMLFELSVASTIKEIDMPASLDEAV